MKPLWSVSKLAPVKVSVSAPVAQAPPTLPPI
jgi:hypothetical protein